MCYDAFYSTSKKDWNQEKFELYVQKLVEAHANKFITEMKSVRNNKIRSPLS